MAITINTQTFSVESQEKDSVVYLKDGGDLATPYRIKTNRTLPKNNVKGSVLRGMNRLTRVFTDGDGNPHQVIVTITSSVPVITPGSVLGDVEADVEAFLATNASSDVLFRGKIY